MKNGEGEIRTLEGLTTLPVFETSAFNHSATSPNNGESCSEHTKERGESRIRTCEDPKALTVFKTAAFNHSAISPEHADSLA